MTRLLLAGAIVLGAASCADVVAETAQPHRDTVRPDGGLDLTDPTTTTTTTTVVVVASTLPRRQVSRTKPAPSSSRPPTARAGGGDPPVISDNTAERGDLLMRIARCEGYPRFVHADHGPTSTASGGLGFLDSTWNNYKGYPRAMDAPWEIQLERGAADLARLGTRPWNASKSCWSR